MQLSQVLDLCAIIPCRPTPQRLCSTVDETIIPVRLAYLWLLKLKHLDFAKYSVNKHYNYAQFEFVFGAQRVFRRVIETLNQLGEPNFAVANTHTSTHTHTQQALVSHSCVEAFDIGN